MTFYHLLSSATLAVFFAATMSAHAKSKTHLPHRLIALEEHAVLPSLPPIGAFYVNSLQSAVVSKLEDVGEGRIKDLDAGHVSLQVVSQIPGLASTNPDGCRAANDELAAAVSKHPERLKGFAALPMAYPNQAATELERAIKELGFLGAMIDNHLPDGTYYDDEKYWSVFAKAEELDVPIYIHPAPPTPTQMNASQGNYPPQAAFKIGSAAWGWHADVGFHIIRLYAAGLFTRFPNLKIILGHDGEVLPMMIDRVDDTRLRNDCTFNQVWNKNIWITTAGFFHLRAFEMLLKVTKPERVMFSIDYPLVNITDGWDFAEKLAESKLLSEEEMDGFAYANAEKLLKLNE